MGIISFVLAIVGFLGGIIWNPWIAIILGAIGIAWGVMARRGQKRRLATAGFVTSIVVTSCFLFWIVFWLLVAWWADRNIGYFT